LKKLLIGISVVAFLVIGLMPSVSATTITITPLTQVQWSGKDPGNPAATEIPAIVGYSGVLYELYKQDQGDSDDDGTWASYYTTTFSNTEVDPNDAEIKWVGTGTDYISGSPIYLLVKDGQGVNIDPWWYVFNLSGLSLDLNGDGSLESYSWNGMDTIFLDGFWDDKGAISHVSLYGTGQSVPEPATMLLLGTGLIGLAGIGRKKFFKKG